jgi:threonylcarbamoyladenosine tRNA methylthiotransferase MtaB
MKTFYIEQFGCRATQADGAAIEQQLRERGLYAADEPSGADVVVVNTCTVTAAADAQARDAVRKICAQNPAARVIVTGCYAQRAPEELAALPGVAWVVGNSHKPEIPWLAESVAGAASGRAERAGTGFVPSAALAADGLTLLDGAAKILTGDIFAERTMLAAPVTGGEGSHTRPVVKIQDGCNSRCAYCVIPFVRGRSRSLPAGEVLEEIARLSAAGVREVVLSGINLGMYGQDLSPKVDLILLLRRILEETGIERLRISSIEPMDVTEELIALFAANERAAQHFHMPLQSGCDRVLKAMHRWYRAEHYAKRVELIREKLPNAGIGADVIAGFPGETDAEHAETVAFIERLPFTYMHVFSFSERPGTRAAGMNGKVAAATVKERARDLRVLGERKAKEFRRSQAGQRLRALTLHGKDSSAGTPALASNYLRLTVRGKLAANEWVDVEVAEDGVGAEIVGTRPETTEVTTVSV